MIHLATGEVNLQFEDFRFFSPVPLEWNRSYHSRVDYDGPLGAKWHCCYDQHVRVDDANGVLHWLQKGGMILELPMIEVGEEAVVRSERLLYARSTEGFSIRELDEEFVNHFKWVGGSSDIYKLVAISYRRFKLEFFYTPKGELEHILDPSGRLIRILRDQAGLATSVELDLGNGKRPDVLVQYGYDEEGTLISITDALGQSEHFTYANGLLVQRKDRNGHGYHWEYEGPKNEPKCVRRWQSGGLLHENFAYVQNVTTLTDALGNSTVYRTQNELVIEEIDALGNVQSWGYNEEGEVLAYTDQIGNVTYYDYDDYGNQVSITQPNGGNTAYVYENHKLAMAKNAVGAVWVWVYDKAGFLESRIGPDGDVTRYKYENDLLSELIDANGLKTRLFYNDAFTLEKIILPNGSEAQWEYDDRGQLTIAQNPNHARVNFEYDPLGRVKNIRGADGNRTQLEYDGVGNVVKAKDRHHSVEFEYRPTGKLLSRTENKTTVAFKYDRLDRLTAIQNEEENFYRFEYNSVGKMVLESGFDGLTRKFERDAAGKVAKVLTPDQKEVVYRYDKLGNIQKVVYHDGTEEIFVYDRTGRLIEAINENGAVKLERDKVGRVEKEIQGAFTVESSYNRMGQRIGIKSSLGADIKIGRDKEGKIASTTATNGEVIWEAHFKRDAVGLELERSMPGGIVSSWERDLTGKPLEHRVGRGSKAFRRKTYHWQVNDRLKSITDELTKGTVRFDHDLFGNLASAHYEDGSWDFKLPDAVGNLFRKPNRSDRKYSPAGALLRDERYTYTYDELGNLILKEAGGERWEYRWTPNGMLHEVVRPDRKVVGFAYDALGRRLSKSFDGQVTRWVWDGNVPLHEWVGAAEDTASIAVGGDLKESYPQSPVTWVFDEGTFSPAAKIVGGEMFSIVSDYLGKPEQMHDGDGFLVWNVEYDIYGKIRKLGAGSLKDCPFRYPGQYFDLETGLYYNRFRYYDPESGGYLSQDPIGLMGTMPNLYSFVADANIQFDGLGLATITLRHYTSNAGLEGIKNDMKIVAYDQNTVFTERAKGKALSAADAADKYGIKKGSARNYIEFEVDADRVSVVKNKITGATEYTVKGDVDLSEKTTKFVKRCC
jgi:RHS repeat-associated protein